MLQQEEPDDYVVATNETYSIREFLDISFQYVNLNWQDYVEFDERYLRPAEVDLLAPVLYAAFRLRANLMLKL